MKRWLSLKEAAEYAHMGKDRLMDLANRGIIKGCQDPDSKRRDWIFDLLSLDAYREGQMVQATAREKALAIMRDVKL